MIHGHLSYTQFSTTLTGTTVVAAKVRWGGRLEIWAVCCRHRHSNGSGCWRMDGYA